MVYSLHACDLATDKMLFLAVKNSASTIMSVSCCQHSFKKQLKCQFTYLSKNNIFRDRLAYMVGDTMRSLLLEAHNYKTNIIEFVSSRYTDKNIMLRAERGHIAPLRTIEARKEYESLCSLWSARPELERYLNGFKA